MNSYMHFFDYRKLLSVALALTLMFGIVTMSLDRVKSDAVNKSTTQILSAEAASMVVGGDPGGCGIAVGIAAGLAALALGGVTFGMGAAVALSAGFHFALILCAS